MYPTQDRIKELQERFGVHNGQFWGYYRFKNLNWYFNDEWFCFGDIREEDLLRLVELLKEGEVLTIGWKELGPDSKESKIAGDGGGLWLIINSEGVQYDRRAEAAKKRESA